MKTHGNTSFRDACIEAIAARTNLDKAINAHASDPYNPEKAQAYRDARVLLSIAERAELQAAELMEKLSTK